MKIIALALVTLDHPMALSKICPILWSPPTFFSDSIHSMTTPISSDLDYTIRRSTEDVSHYTIRYGVSSSPKDHHKWEASASKIPKVKALSFHHPISTGEPLSRPQRYQDTRTSDLEGEVNLHFPYRRDGRSGVLY
jgi:hypothetical protein